MIHNIDLQRIDELSKTSFELGVKSNEILSKLCKIIFSKIVLVVGSIACLSIFVVLGFFGKKH